MGGGGCRRLRRAGPVVAHSPGLRQLALERLSPGAVPPGRRRARRWRCRPAPPVVAESWWWRPRWRPRATSSSWSRRWCWWWSAWCSGWPCARPGGLGWVCGRPGGRRGLLGRPVGPAAGGANGNVRPSSTRERPGLVRRVARLPRDRAGGRCAPIWLTHLPQSFLKVSPARGGPCPLVRSDDPGPAGGRAVVAYLKGTPGLAARLRDDRGPRGRLRRQLRRVPDQERAQLRVSHRFPVGGRNPDLGRGPMGHIGAIALAWRGKSGPSGPRVSNGSRRGFGLAAIAGGLGAVGATGLTRPPTRRRSDANRAEVTLIADRRRLDRTAGPGGSRDRGRPHPQLLHRDLGDQAVAYRLDRTDGCRTRAGSRPSIPG